MSAALTPNRAEAGFWLIVLLGLGGGIGLETDWGRKTQSPVTEIAETPPEFPKPVLAEPFRLPDSDQFREITVRPLFVVTRRPAPNEPPAASVKPSMKKDQFILMGTTIVPEGSFAFLLEKAGNKSRVVARGKEINGITLREVSADRVLLVQDDEWELLELRTKKPPGAASATPSFPAAPFASRPPSPAPFATPPTPAVPGATPPPVAVPGAAPPASASGRFLPGSQECSFGPFGAGGRPASCSGPIPTPTTTVTKGQAPQPAGSAR